MLFFPNRINSFHSTSRIQDRGGYWGATSASHAIRRCQPGTYGCLFHSARWEKPVFIKAEKLHFLLLSTNENKVPVNPQVPPLAPYPPLSSPTPTTSPVLRTTPVCCASTRTREKKFAESSLLMTPFMRKRRALTSASVCRWAVSWGPVSHPPKSQFWQTAMMVSGVLSFSVCLKYQTPNSLN